MAERTLCAVIVAAGGIALFCLIEQLLEVAR